MTNYNTNLKRNKAFVAFLKSLKPGWAEEGGHLLLIDNSQGVRLDNIAGRTKWLPHEEWWQAYVQADRNHLREHEIAEFAAVIAAGEDCTLTVPALRFLEFIAQYYCEMSGKRSLKTAPAIEKEEAEEPRTALLSLAEYCVENNISTRKMRVVSASDDDVVAVVAGEYLEFNRTRLVGKEKAVKPVASLSADCPF